MSEGNIHPETPTPSATTSNTPDVSISPIPTPTPEATSSPISAEGDLSAKISDWINGGQEATGPTKEFTNPFTSEPFQGILLGEKDGIQTIGMQDQNGNYFSVAMKPEDVKSISTVIATPPIDGLK